jgi:hypothetical protein
MFYFRAWLTPVLIKPICYVGSAACIIWGLCLIITNSPRQSIQAEPGSGYITTYYPADWHMVGVGWAWMLLGPIGLRIICETIAAIFLLREAAETVESE